MEWLHRMDSRLVELVREKFSTKLSAGSNILIAMIETLSKNINCYVTILNASRAIGADTLIKTLCPKDFQALIPLEPNVGFTPKQAVNSSLSLV